MEFTGNNEYASKGVGTAGLTLGIIGTALATLAGGGSLLNANNRSNGNGSCNSGCNGGTDHTDETCKLRSQVAKLEAEKYTDNAALDIRDRFAALNEKVIGYVIDLDKKQAELAKGVECLNSKIDYEQKLTSQKIDCCCEKTDLRIQALRDETAAEILYYLVCRVIGLAVDEFQKYAPLISGHVMQHGSVCALEPLLDLLCKLLLCLYRRQGAQLGLKCSHLLTCLFSQRVDLAHGTYHLKVAAAVDAAVEDMHGQQLEMYDRVARLLVAIPIYIPVTLAEVLCRGAFGEGRKQECYDEDAAHVV